MYSDGRQARQTGRQGPGYVREIRTKCTKRNERTDSNQQNQALHPPTPTTHTDTHTHLQIKDRMINTAKYQPVP